LGIFSGHFWASCLISLYALTSIPQFVDLGNRSFFIEDLQRRYVQIPEYNLV
jgi:hypothetical protein